MSKANTWCYWFYVMSQLVTVPLPSEVSINSSNMLLAVPVLNHALPLRLLLHHPLFFLPALSRLCMPSLLMSLLSGVFTGTEITVFALNSCATLSWYTVCMFVSLKTYCTATEKVIWPLKEFFSQESSFLMFPSRSGFSQKMQRCSQQVLRCLAKCCWVKPAFALEEWLLAGVPMEMLLTSASGLK